MLDRVEGRVEVTEELAAALRRARDQRQTFNEAWPMAVAVAVLSAPRAERQAWREALDETMPEWRACYERRPARQRSTVALQVLTERRSSALA